MQRRVRRQLLYSSVYLVWTAILLFGVIWFAALHLVHGGFLTILWVLFLASLGLRVGRIGAKETVRQIYALGLPLTVLMMLMPIVGWRLCLRRISRSEAAEQIRLLFRQLRAVAIQELSAGGGQSTSLRPFVSVALSWIWAAMFIFGLLILIGVHNGSGLTGWVWLFLGAGVLFFWYYAGRRGFGAAVAGVVAMLIAFFRMIGSIFSEPKSR